MTRRRIVMLLAIVLALVGGGVGLVVWASRQVPEFYEEALAVQPDPVVRQKSAKDFVQRATRLVNDIQFAEQWSEEFHQDQVNSWVAEELHAKYREVVPPGVAEPRVMFHDGLIKVGFRYDDPRFRGVVSLELRPWVPEPNLLALEIRSVKAGLVPIPLDQVIDQVTRQFETHGWRVRWQQLDGNDVLIVQLDRGHSDQPILERVELADGALRISGSRKPGSSPSERGHFRLSKILPMLGQSGAR